jgi:poly(A) polymerase
MILSEAEWQRRPGLAAVLDALGARDGETRFVGGCVRDTLMGLDVSDVDLATRLLPQEVIRRLEAAGVKAVPTGLAHGTVTAVSKGRPVEVTTLRRDVSTDGRHAIVAFTDDWQADAARRDFTINALSAEPVGGEVHDYFGGLADLAARRVRFIGDPLSRIAEDHLRILRFFRFHARFGSGAPDPAGLEACTARANDLMALSRERIASELLRLLDLPDPGATVEVMIARGIFRPVLPEILSAERLHRLIAREEEVGLAAPRRSIRRLAALIPEDRAVADAIAHRLKLSSADRLVLGHDADRANWRSGSPFQRSHGVGPRVAIDRLLLGDEPIGTVRKQIEILLVGSAPVLPLKGSDLIALGLPAGPLVSKTMAMISRLWVEEDFPPSPRLDAIVRDAVDQALRSTQ